MSSLSKAVNNSWSLFILSILGGLLLWLGWPPLRLNFLLFVAFIPLLIINHRLVPDKKKRTGWKFFFYCFMTLLVWNGLTTWWIWHASPVGACFAIVANSLLMFIPWRLFRSTLRKLGEYAGYIALPAYWVAFEYLHLNWELSWPWLTLGNGFSMFPQWVQWYEFTGALGGTLWVLIVNVIIFIFLFKRKSYRRKGVDLLKIAGVLLLPVAVSLIRYYTYKEKGRDVEVAVVQPNYDPYTEKFRVSEQDQLERFLSLSEEALSKKTLYLVWPETAIFNWDAAERYSYSEEDPLRYPTINAIKDFLAKYPNATLITGINSYTTYKNKDEITATADSTEALGYHDTFNAAMMLQGNGTFDFYEKSHLVLGVETLPFQQYLKFLGSMSINLGGTSGSLGKGQDQTVFPNVTGINACAPVCYESIYGDYIKKFVNNGAHVIFIITNDGWWKDTPGYKQHFHYASLRAVETRRSIARSANTGISGFFNQRGDIISQSEWGETGSLTETIRANDKITFYTTFGDFLGKIAAFFSAVLIFVTLVKDFF